MIGANCDCKKSILLITCDQLRADCLGCYGNKIIRTPSIDSIAARGTRFENMFTAYPVCAPNRATLATGRYPSVHGLRRNGMFLPKSEVTMMEVLRQHGYATAGVGKMHFGPQWRFNPDGSPLCDPGPEMAVNPQPEPWELPWYGFEEAWITEDNRVGPYAEYLTEQGYDVWADPHNFSYPQHQTVLSAYPVEHHQTTWIADRSIDFLDKQTGERPFFLWTSFVAPHHPFVVPAPYDTMYNPEDMPLSNFDETETEHWPEAYMRKYTLSEGSHEAIGMNKLTDADRQRIAAYYYGSITQIDEQIGRLVDILREKGMLEDTIIVFTADHGEMLGDHHLMFKATTYDEVTRMPLIVSLPGGSEAHCEGLCCSIDIMPTVLDLVGAAVPGGVQGTSLQACLEEPDLSVRDSVLIETQYPTQRAVRTEQALMSWHGPGRQSELYDLRTDPAQQVNLWNRVGFEKLQQEMTELLMEQMALNVDPQPVRAGVC
jgi:arylsulfatase